MRAWRRIGATALLLLAATGSPASAEAELERARIQFTAPKGCPDEAAFLHALKKRTRRFGLASGAEQARLFVATVSRAGSSVSGRLEIRDPGAEPSVRNVLGSNCAEVVAALAFMTALAIDTSVPAENLPHAGPASTAPASTAAPPAAAAAAATSEPAEPQETNRPRIVPSPDLALSSPLAVQLAPAPSAPGSPRWSWAVGAAGQMSVAVSPTLGLGGLLFVETAAPDGSGLGPLLRAGLFVAQSDVTVASGAGARFAWAGTMVEGCPLRLTLADARVTLYPCLAFRLGVLRGEGRALDQPEKTSDVWSDLGPVARVRFAVLAHLWVELDGMLVVPLRHLTFAVHDEGPAQPATTVFSVPPLGALVGIGLAYELR